MILTWLWKLVQWFRRGDDPPALEAARPPLRSADDLGFINQSTDQNNADPVIFAGPNDPLSRPLSSTHPGQGRDPS
ncbi:hypothetical protein [Caulobacter sp. DWP3-1-3b2]|uniref:hypothetical protein n=1 Tax=Caulobacter sp. DWP3-1-3b2 TaxID=2804643 RepID=UPI003CEEFB67